MILVVGMVVTLAIWLVTGLVFGPRDGLMFALLFGEVSALAFGSIALGPIAWNSRIVQVIAWNSRIVQASAWNSRIVLVKEPQWSGRAARSALRVGLIPCLSFGLYLGLGGALAIVVYDGLQAVRLWLVLGLSCGLLFGLLLGLAAMISAGFKLRGNFWPPAPREGVRAAVKASRTVGLATGLVVGPAAVLFSTLTFGWTGLVSGGPTGALPGALGFGLALGLSTAVANGLRAGGASYLRHRLLCALLWYDKLIPSDLVRFLDYAESRILLRRVGGGYLFVHRLLQDHFAVKAPRAHSPEE